MLIFFSKFIVSKHLLNTLFINYNCITINLYFLRYFVLNNFALLVDLNKMSFFESDIVQEEAKQLFNDYQELMKLGSDYGKFDREGKKMFIKRMETLMDRYKVFMKRFELSEDFQAKMTVEQLKTQLGQFGITPEQMFDQMNKTLLRMKNELDQSS